MTVLIYVDSRPLLCSLNELIEGKPYTLDGQFIDAFGQVRYILSRNGWPLFESYPAHLFLTEAEDKMMTDLIFELGKQPFL